MKKLGMKLSGGADSAIVYYNLCKDNPDAEIYCLTLATSEKPYYIMLARRVIELVYDMTGVRPTKHLTKFIEHDAEEYVKGQEEMAETLFKTYHCEEVYSGITSNPPIDDMQDYFYSNHRELDLKEVLIHIDKRDKERDMLPGPERPHAPFALKHKRDVAKAYEEAGVLDSLYPITNSCEAVEEVDDDGYPIHCEHCFFCAERWYGFGRIV